MEKDPKPIAEILNRDTTQSPTTTRTPTKYSGQDTLKNRVNFDEWEKRRVTNEDLAENEQLRQLQGYAPNPLCQVCHGSGWVHPLKYDMTPDYSKVILCKADDCVEDSKKTWLATGQPLTPYGVTKRLQTFEHYKPRSGTQASYDAFYNLAHGTAQKPFLLCYGSTGCGKTHLCQALTAKLNRRGIKTYYYSIPSLFSALKKAIDDKEVESWVSVLSKCPGLVLDDFASETYSDWALGKLREIIDARWTDQLTTVVTTNKTLTQIQQISPRLYSRMCDQDISKVVQNTGSDYRTSKRVTK